MERRVGSLLIESVAAESAKFTAPILLVHGLWCTAAAWRRFMGYLAHHGWSCHAVTLRGRAGGGTPVAVGRIRFADYRDDVQQAIAACEAPPVLLGHDLGALLALHCAPSARAVVALAPLVPRPFRLQVPRIFRGVQARIAMLRTAPLPPPRGRLAIDAFGLHMPATITADSSTVVSELIRDDLSFAVSANVPTLIVGGQADAVSVPTDLERLATHSGAQLRSVAEAGHGLPWDTGWEKRVSEIHRWLIQQLGEPLLAMRDDEES